MRLGCVCVCSHQTSTALKESFLSILWIKIANLSVRLALFSYCRFCVVSMRDFWLSLCPSLLLIAECWKFLLCLNKFMISIIQRQTFYSPLHCIANQTVEKSINQLCWNVDLNWIFFNFSVQWVHLHAINNIQMLIAWNSMFSWM